MIDWKANILKTFRTKVELGEEEEATFISKWESKPEVLNRNDFLIRKGDVESNLFFVISGAMRIYYPHQEEEVCVGFAYDNNLICSYPSFIKKEPSEYYIQALRQTDVVSISRSDLYKLFDRFPRIERAWRMLQEDALLGKIEREVEMLTFTPEERYRRLMLRSPHIFQIIPKKYIASYLRMSPETLSRIHLI